MTKATMVTHLKLKMYTLMDQVFFKIYFLDELFESTLGILD